MMKQITLICAMPHEIAPFLTLLELKQAGRAGTIRVWQGEFQDHTVTLVLSGIGKVHAAAAAQLAIERYAPDAILSCGTAGALSNRCEIGDLIVGKTTIQHDYGFIMPEIFLHDGLYIGKPKGKRKHVKEFPADVELLRTAETCQTTWQKSNHIFLGTLLTGDQVIFSLAKRQALARQFNALGVEMESAAIAQVCLMRGVPFLSIRGISDHADESFPLDITHIDPDELHSFSSASLGKKVSLLTQAVNYFVHHPTAFIFSLQARQHMHTAVENSAEFALHLLENLS